MGIPKISQQKPIVIQNGLPKAMTVPKLIIEPVKYPIFNFGSGSLNVDNIDKSIVPTGNIASNITEQDYIRRKLEEYFERSGIRKSYVTKFEKLPLDLQKKLIYNKKIFNTEKETFDIPFPEKLLDNKDSETLLNNFEQIISHIDEHKFSKDEFLDIYYDYITYPEILKANPDLVTELFNTKNEFALNLLGNNFPEEDIQKYIEQDLFTPKIIEVLNNSNLWNISNDIMKSFLDLGREELEEIFSYFSHTNLRNFLILTFKEADVNTLKANKDRLKGSFSEDPLLDKIISKAVAIPQSAESELKEKILRGKSITDFYLKYYGEKINHILSDNTNILLLNPIEYDIPEMDFIKENLVYLSILDKETCNKDKLFYYTPHIKSIIVDFNNNEKFYEIEPNGTVALNNGSKIEETDNEIILYKFEGNQTKNKKKKIILEKIIKRKDGFATVIPYKNGKPANYGTSYREVLKTGAVRKNIHVQSKDNLTFIKKVTSSYNNSRIQNEVELKDRNNNRILNLLTEIQKNKNGNTVIRRYNNKTDIYSSKIEGENVILTHNNKTYKIPIIELVYYTNSNNPSLDYAALILCGNTNSKNVEEKILNFSQKTIDNFKTFLRNLNADDLLAIAKNRQTIKLNQFGYNNAGKSLATNDYAFFGENFQYLKLNPHGYSSITNTHEITHGIDDILKISQNKLIRKLYNEEMKNISAEGKYYLDYFLNCSASPAGGLGELVPEAGAIVNANDTINKDMPSNAQSIRMIKLMQEFPRTTAEIIKLLIEYKRNL